MVFYPLLWINQRNIWKYDFFYFFILTFYLFVRFRHQRKDLVTSVDKKLPNGFLEDQGKSDLSLGLLLFFFYLAVLFLTAVLSIEARCMYMRSSRAEQDLMWTQHTLVICDILEKAWVSEWNYRQMNGGNGHLSKRAIKKFSKEEINVFLSNENPYVR